MRQYDLISYIRSLTIKYSKLQLKMQHDIETYKLQSIHVDYTELERIAEIIEELRKEI